MKNIKEYKNAREPNNLNVNGKKTFGNTHGDKEKKGGKEEKVREGRKKVKERKVKGKGKGGEKERRSAKGLATSPGTSEGVPEERIDCRGPENTGGKRGTGKRGSESARRGWGCLTLRGKESGKRRLETDT